MANLLSVCLSILAMFAAECSSVDVNIFPLSLSQYFDGSFDRNRGYAEIALTENLLSSAFKETGDYSWEFYMRPADHSSHWDQQVLTVTTNHYACCTGEKLPAFTYSESGKKLYFKYNVGDSGSEKLPHQGASLSIDHSIPTKNWWHIKTTSCKSDSWNYSEDFILCLAEMTNTSPNYTCVSGSYSISFPILHDRVLYIGGMPKQKNSETGFVGWVGGVKLNDECKT